MWTHFLPAIVKAKEWLDNGKIGQLQHIKADFWLPFTALSRRPARVQCRIGWWLPAGDGGISGFN